MGVQYERHKFCKTPFAEPHREWQSPGQPGKESESERASNQQPYEEWDSHHTSNVIVELNSVYSFPFACFRFLDHSFYTRLASLLQWFGHLLSKTLDIIRYLDLGFKSPCSEKHAIVIPK